MGGVAPRPWRGQPTDAVLRCAPREHRHLPQPAPLPHRRADVRLRWCPGATAVAHRCRPRGAHGAAAGLGVSGVPPLTQCRVDHWGRIGRAPARPSLCLGSASRSSDWDPGRHWHHLRQGWHLRSGADLPPGLDLRIQRCRCPPGSCPDVREPCEAHLTAPEVCGAAHLTPPPWESFVEPALKTRLQRQAEPAVAANMSASFSAGSEDRGSDVDRQATARSDVPCFSAQPGPSARVAWTSELDGIMRLTVRCPGSGLKGAHGSRESSTCAPQQRESTQGAGQDKEASSV